jgi:glutamyl-tRNA(Gln) amidotransferase subunit D
MARSIAERFHAAGVQLGDTVRLTKGERVDEGVLMPRHAFSRADVAILKTASGYNVGIAVDDTTQIELVRRGEPRPRPARATTPSGSKPVVAILGTGGTIASYVDYRTGAVHPAASAEELAYATPEIFDVAQIRAEVVYQVFSEDLTPKNWLELARRVKTAFDQGAKGVVIPHGTDTLGYTAAALSFLLRDLPGPVVLAGAQRSSDRPSSDAATNLLAAVRVAATADVGEVLVAMHASSDDVRIALHRGVRVRKNHSSRRDAFESVNTDPIGHVEGDRVVLHSAQRHRAAGPCRVYPTIADDVAYVHAYPGLTPEALEAAVPGRGAVIAGTGLGHLPRRTLDAVERLVRRGAVLVMATQCLWGRVDLDVYSTGRDLRARGVISAEDMLPETAFAKLCWALGNAPDPEAVRGWMQTDQVGEIQTRSRFDGGPARA